MIAINFERLLLCSMQIELKNPRTVAFSLAALAYENIILDKNGQGTDGET